MSIFFYYKKEKKNFLFYSANSNKKVLAEKIYSSPWNGGKNYVKIVIFIVKVKQTHSLHHNLIVNSITPEWDHISLSQGLSSVYTPLHFSKNFVYSAMITQSSSSSIPCIRRGLSALLLLIAVVSELVPGGALSNSCKDDTCCFWRRNACCWRELFCCVCCCCCLFSSNWVSCGEVADDRSGSGNVVDMFDARSISSSSYDTKEKVEW